MNLIEMWHSTTMTVETMYKAEQAAGLIMARQMSYKRVSQKIGRVPFYVIGVIHYRESNFDFETFLANGDPLFDEKTGQPLVTVHVPKGLGPFKTWEDAAEASLLTQAWNSNSYHWDLENALDNLERYNGLGYRKRGLVSPYPWAGTNHYKKGKFVADGVFDENAVDKQLGCVPILKMLQLSGVDLGEIRSA